MTKPDYTSLDLPAPPADRPYVFLNMVMSLDGKVVVEGTEQGIGSKVDQRLMRELRVSADIVLNGANTLRASGTSSRLGDPILEALRVSRGKPKSPVAAVLSADRRSPWQRRPCRWYRSTMTLVAFLLLGLAFAFAELISSRSVGSRATRRARCRRA